jgi:hypothetical protein
MHYPTSERETSKHGMRELDCSDIASLAPGELQALLEGTAGNIFTLFGAPPTIQMA